MAGETLALVPFTLDDRRCALRLDVVVRVEQAVRITPLPDAPPVVLGLVDWHGTLVPVVDLRVRFGMPSRPERAEDHLVVARTSRRLLAVLADAVEPVVEVDAAGLLPLDDMIPGATAVAGVARLADGLVVVHDLDTALSLDDETALDQALARRGEVGL